MISAMTGNPPLYHIHTKLKPALKWCGLLLIYRQLYCLGRTNATFKTKPFVPINAKFCRVLETSKNVLEMLKLLT